MPQRQTNSRGLDATNEAESIRYRAAWLLVYYVVRVDVRTWEADRQAIFWTYAHLINLAIRYVPRRYIHQSSSLFAMHRRTHRVILATKFYLLQLVLRIENRKNKDLYWKEEKQTIGLKIGKTKNNRYYLTELRTSQSRDSQILCSSKL